MLRRPAAPSLRDDSRRTAPTGDEIDFALLVDGLEAEREQGITIDVAYRFFATPRRAFIVADTPGHEQYTRNMATGASNADLAVLLVDARKGLLDADRAGMPPSCSLLGIRHVVLAVNKIDLVELRRGGVRRHRGGFTASPSRSASFHRGRSRLGARCGDNVAARTTRCPGTRGPTLLEHLETVETTRAAEAPLPLPGAVGEPARPDFRGFSGTVAVRRVAGATDGVAASGRSRRSVARSSRSTATARRPRRARR